MRLEAWRLKRVKTCLTLFLGSFTNTNKLIHFEERWYTFVVG